MSYRITVVKRRIDNGRGNGAGCFEIKTWMDIPKFTYMALARLRHSSKIKPRL